MQKDFKMRGRLANFFRKRLNEIGLGDVHDPRNCKGKRWSLPSMLRVLIAGMVSGEKCLGGVESMTMNLSPLTRRFLGISKRLPDTTMRDCLVKLKPENLRSVLHRTIQLAVRRKSLIPDGFPCGIVALDGKWTATRMPDPLYAQHYSNKRSKRKIRKSEHVRTITSCLISSKAKVCIDMHSIPPETNEGGVFMDALDSLLDKYKELFQFVTYDSGVCYKENADYVEEKGLYYFFALKNNQPTLFEKAFELLGHHTGHICAETSEVVNGKLVNRRLWKDNAIAGYHNWQHLQTVFRVQSQTIEIATGKLLTKEDRCFITNAKDSFFSDEQYLSMIRGHWAVENNCHNTWDRIFREDDRPWVLEPQGMLVVQILRRIAYNIMALFRSVTQRSDKKRQMPWKELMRELSTMFLTLTITHFPSKSNGRRIFVTI